MKKINLLTVALLASSVLGGTLVNADTDSSATSIGKVSVGTLTEELPENPDPEGGGEITDPEITNPEGSRFKVIHASNLEFGEVVVTAKEQIVKAQTSEVTTTSEGVAKRVPWVTTYDMRNSTERSDWELKASATPLEDGNGHVLRGAEITLYNLNYAGDSERAPKAETGKITLGTSAQKLATATAYSGEGTQDTGVGSWSLAMGYKTNDELETDGVELRIPSNIVINEGVEYTSTITWEMATTP
ncbi:WxL domain-containing protein [Vagococcus xieshaowenii]|uniref:WxL domain-containing protein n=1 Tax=Vagococcus xieshaowenii TaxID=2562451 RepID=A0AAJ5JM51_9ENTE|nr:WxL domain-containing protein [Vagococcus xieshaowenii]QCA28171.1 WxL domain-containing protein [Vagococcus xieshaowenii]TFZ42524.1 WxL domain-containing protein [Vagococcus xieshaowenii]